VECSRPADVRQSEADLVVAARSGSATAFTTLVDRYYPVILAYMARQTGDREWARDLSQETFLDAFRSLDKLPEDRSFRAWLFVIARNNYRHALRKRRVRQFVSLDWLVADRRRPELSEEGEARDFAERDAVQQALNQLTPALREPLVLLSLGYTLKEAADLLDISHAAARQRTSRGLRRLQEILTDDHGGENR
jgi:RNA polymerase sigma-70 factor (ECF subfamily)